MYQTIVTISSDEKITLNPGFDGELTIVGESEYNGCKITSVLVKFWEYVEPEELTNEILIDTTIHESTIEYDY